jgi:hypothetical protein
VRKKYSTLYKSFPDIVSKDGGGPVHESELESDLPLSELGEKS